MAEHNFWLYIAIHTYVTVGDQRIRNKGGNKAMLAPVIHIV